MGYLKTVIEAGQRGITKLFRLEDDTIDIFDEPPQFDSENTCSTIDVDANGFGVMYRDSPERFLHTFNVNVCSGIALACPDEDFHALVHLYSNRSHYVVPNAKEAIENHARVAWKKFAAFLPPHMIFNAVSFGGKNKLDGVPAGLPDPDLVKKYYTGPDQVAGIEETEENAILGQMAICASTWLGDAFFEAAYDSGKIASLENVRYRKHAHHVLIDKVTGKIYFGKVGDKLNEEVIEKTRRTPAGYLFPHLGITKQIA